MKHRLDKILENEILDRIKADVEPVCKEFGFSYGKLGSSQDRGLYGFNRGKGEIIRLRLVNVRTGKPRTYNAILYTMLHEICHCRYTSHGPRFYTLLRKVNEFANRIGLYDTKGDWSKMPPTRIRPPYSEPNPPTGGKRPFPQTINWIYSKSLKHG